MNIEDAGELLAYLRGLGRLGPQETADCAVLAGGVSNRTVRVTFPDGRACVLKQALPKLRVKEEWFSDPARVGREAAALRQLKEVAPPGSVPGLVFEDPSHDLLAMEAAALPHDNWKDRLLSGRIEPAHVVLFGRWLGQVHERTSALSDSIGALFADWRFFESLRLEPYYACAAGRNPTLASFFDQLIGDTRATRLALVHGDYSPKNVLIHADKLIVLDYEVAHFGDPAFDLGFALTHLLSKAHHVRCQRGGFIEASGLFWNAYRAAAGRFGAEPRLEARAVRHTLACLLARVDGRSPLEYLTVSEQDVQRAAVRQLAVRPARTLPELIASWAGLLEKDKGKRTKDKGKRTKDKGKRTKDKGKRTKDKGQRTKGR